MRRPGRSSLVRCKRHSQHPRSFGSRMHCWTPAIVASRLGLPWHDLTCCHNALGAQIVLLRTKYVRVCFCGKKCESVARTRGAFES